MGFNKTGKPNTEHYTLGRGCVFMGNIINNIPCAYRDLGNAPEFNMTVTEETLEHLSSRTGIAITDKEITTSKKVEGNFTLDEINFQNLALFFSATENEGVVQDPVAAIPEFVLKAANNWEKGAWFDILTAPTGDRTFDILTAQLTVTAGVTAMVEGVDYELDLEFGRIFIISTSTVDPTSDPLNIAFGANWSTRTAVDQINGLTVSAPSVALKFIGENPADENKHTEYQIHKTTVRAEGDLPLIGDDWQTVGFSFTVEKDSSRPAGDQFFIITDLP